MTHNGRQLVEAGLVFWNLLRLGSSCDDTCHGDFVSFLPCRNVCGGKIMIDGYTKTILTVIAALLFILAIQQIVGPASAQIGSQCGYQRDVPCYIMIIPSPNPTL
jgi:hypothetical protein